MEFKEEDYLQISGIQHFLFCRRQWALIYVEAQWEENVKTAEGRVMHERVHDPSARQKRGKIISVPAMPVFSKFLGCSGECDLVEFHRESDGVILEGRDGYWAVYPVEYKRGKPKTDHSDEAQLCVQALCLEEMFSCSINHGFIYYGEQKHRYEVIFTEDLRNLVRQSLMEMHQMMKRGHTPEVRRHKGCNLCSLCNKCMPSISDKQKVRHYIRNVLEEEAE